MKKLFDQEVGSSGKFAPYTGVMIEYPGLLNAMSAADNLRVLANINDKISDDAINDLIQSVGLNAYDKRHVRKYSVGMKQKLGIAMALLGQPKLLLLDEPTNNLDEESTATIHRLINDYAQKGATVVIASHDKNEIEELCDHIIMLKNGKVVEVS